MSAAVRDGKLDDVQLSALSTVMRTGTEALRDEMSRRGRDGGRDLLTRRAQAARTLIAAPEFERIVRTMTYGDSHYLITSGGGSIKVRGYEIAALAMQPGGIRLFGVVFCGDHHPGGVMADEAVACPQCSSSGRFA